MVPAQPSPLGAAPDKLCMKVSVPDGAAWSKERGGMAGFGLTRRRVFDEKHPTTSGTQEDSG